MAGKKGKKGSGKKKKGGKKKKNEEPEMTWKEALLAYQINIKERYLEDIKYELRALEEKNIRHKERNERLINEQTAYMNMLLKQARDFEKQLSEEEVTEKHEVITEMKSNWQTEREEEKEIAALKEQLAKLEGTIELEQKQVDYWTEYKNKAQHDHKKQIELLEQELVDMQTNFNEITAHLTRTLDKTKLEIQQHTDDTLDKQKYLATEKAMAQMDKYSRQEVWDNEWLKKEVEIHHNESDELLRVVEELERESLEIMSELFECTVDDLKISRNVFLTQFQDKENLEESGILDIDLSSIALYDKDKSKLRETAMDKADQPVRPKSATHKYIEDKVFGLTATSEQHETIAEEDEESDYDGNNAESEDDDPFDNYFQFDDEDFDDYLQLGPLELKLLNVTGQQMKIHKPASMSKEELRVKEFKPDQWPVTSKMMQSAFGKPK